MAALRPRGRRATVWRARASRRSCVGSVRTELQGITTTHSVVKDAKVSKGVLWAIEGLSDLVLGVYSVRANITSHYGGPIFGLNLSIFVEM